MATRRQKSSLRVNHALIIITDTFSIIGVQSQAIKLALVPEGDINTQMIFKNVYYLTSFGFAPVFKSKYFTNENE